MPSIDCGGQAGYTCVDPRAPCLDGYVEAGTLTTVTVTASRSDTVSVDSIHDECPPEGCQPELTRDGEVDDQLSRWSCTDSEYPCKLTFSFEEPVDIDYIQVAFYKADQLSRGLEVNALTCGVLRRFASLYIHILCIPSLCTQEATLILLMTT